MARPFTSAKIPVLKPERESLPPDANLCDYCSAKCCRYFALAIDTPEDWEDFENIRWYLLHEHSAVFTENGSWFLLVSTKCKYLGDDNRCVNYENRPPVCRAYTTDKCEYEDNWVYDHYWESPDQIYQYAEALLGPKDAENIRSPQNGCCTL